MSGVTVVHRVEGDGGEQYSRGDTAPTCGAFRCTRETGLLRLISFLPLRILDHSQMCHHFYSNR